MAIDPVQVIARARVRIARLAALRAFAGFVAPALTALALSVLAPQIAAAVAERLGRVLEQGALDGARLGFGLAAAVLTAAGALRGWSAYRARGGFVDAATQIDERLRAHQQVVTLANLTDPQAPEAARLRRSALFPLLWRNVMAVLGGFDPGREFRPGLGKPLARSSLYAAAVAAALGITMLALARPPTRIEKTARRLRETAERLEKAAATPEDRALAAAARRTAGDLTNAAMPRERKMEELKAVMREIKEREKGAAAAKAKGATGAGSERSASKSASGSGGGESKGAGAGKGEGAGAGNAPEKGAGASRGIAHEERKRTASETVELRNEIAKAEAEVESGEKSANRPGAKPSAEAKNGSALRPGANPRLKGGGSRKDQSGPAATPVPTPGQGTANTRPKTALKGRSSPGGKGLGDTHLGEFPAPANYERFYKPGEKGAKLDIRDARYVMFRLPTAAVGGEGGKTVADIGHPRAETPYTNAPLKPAADNAPPEERQLVPPRYRGLIR